MCEQDATLSLRRPRDAPNIWVPWKLCVSTKAVDDCARISNYHYSAVKLFSKYSNKCDHGTYTLQTDNTVASPLGKNRET